MITLTEEQIMSQWGNNSDIKVSVCCITYNQEKYITEAIDSFLMQKTNFPFEIIIGEDKSTDSTLNIINEYKAAFPSIIKVISSESNVGANVNLMRVLKAAKGYYIAICEGDDYWVSIDKLQTQYELMVKYNAKFSCHSAYLDNGVPGAMSIGFDKGRLPKNIYIADIININGQFSPTSSYMINSDVVNGMPAWFSKSTIGDLFIEIYSIGCGVGIYIPKTMSAYRVNAIGSWSRDLNSNLGSFIKKHLNIIDKTTLCAKDFPECKHLFEKRISIIYLDMATRCLLSNRSDLFIMYLRKASEIKKNVSFKHIFYSIFSFFPDLILFFHKLKHRVS